MQQPLTLLFLATSVLAQPAPGAPTTQDPKKVVCKSEETIGTRLGAHKVCKSIAEWTAEADANRESAEDIRQRTSGLLSPDPATPTGGFGIPPGTTTVGGPHR